MEPLHPRDKAGQEPAEVKAGDQAKVPGAARAEEKAAAGDLKNTS